MEERTFATIGVYICIIVGIGSCNLGGYQEGKSALINQKIRGEQIYFGIDEPTSGTYRTLDQKIGKGIENLFTGNFGARLAEKRFKEGKFNKIIEKYKTQQQTKHNI